MVEVAGDHEQLASVLPACSLCTAPKKRRNQTLRKIYRDYKNAAARLKKKSFTALTHSAPHGCGDGYSECPCKRCERSVKVLMAAEDAYTAWKRRRRAMQKLARAFSIVVTTDDARCVKILGHAQRRVALRHAM